MPYTNRTGPRRRVLAVGRATAALLAALALAAGCGDDDDAASPPPTSTTAPAPTPAIDWASVDTVDLGDGWSLADAEGNAPLVAIVRDGAQVGIVELHSFPVDSLDAVAEALAEGEDAALAAHADDFVTALAADRAAGCGEDYEFVAEPVELLDAGDGRAVRYGFTGGPPGEPVSERTVQWAALRGDVLVLAQVSAYDADACVSTEGAELTVADLAEVEPRLAPAIEASDFAAITSVVA